MARSISDILRTSDLSGMLLIVGETEWVGAWLPLRGLQENIRQKRVSNSGDSLARAAVANR